jgi:hypothetical protein
VRRLTSSSSGGTRGNLLVRALACVLVTGGLGAGASLSAAQAWPPAHAGNVREVLDANRIGSVRFGAAARDLVARLDILLGHRPSQRYHLVQACTVDHAIAWPGLLVLFERGRFVGYSYRPAYVNHRIPTLATARGLRVGDTLSLGRQLYGRAFHDSPRGGGRWWASTPRGPVEGLTSGWPNGPRGSVATISAGQLGCPGAAL